MQARGEDALHTLARNNEDDDYIRHAYKCITNSGDKEPKDIHIKMQVLVAELTGCSVDETVSEGMGQRCNQG